MSVPIAKRMPRGNGSAIVMKEEAMLRILSGFWTSFDSMAIPSTLRKPSAIILATQSAVIFSQRGIRLAISFKEVEHLRSLHSSVDDFVSNLKWFSGCS
jgi:hypothetical protein